MRSPNHPSAVTEFDLCNHLHVITASKLHTSILAINYFNGFSKLENVGLFLLEALLAGIKAALSF